MTAFCHLLTNILVWIEFLSLAVNSVPTSDKSFDFGCHVLLWLLIRQKDVYVRIMFLLRISRNYLYIYTCITSTFICKSTSGV